MRTRIVSLIIVAIAAAGCSRQSFERFFTSGERFLTTKRYAEAAIQFENAARANPQSIAAQMKLGDAYAALGQQSNAAAAYQRACALDQHDLAACVRSASALLAIGDYDTAASEARGVLAADRFNLDAQLILASALSGVRRFADAEERLQAAIATASQDPRLYKALSAVQLRRGNAKAAEGSLLQTIKLDPAATDARVSLAQLYLQMGRAADGEKQLRDALAIAPDDALSVLSKVAAKDQGGAARVRMASILYDRGERSKAAEMVDQVLTQDQSSLNGLLLKARMSLDNGDAAAARDYTHRAAEVDPDAPAVREMLAHVNAQP
jgi:tetratricopeptide (TPR) repeat protein